jgi:divalent metal cation (Fe/Co/Zn/Cd) transporter
VSKPPVVIVINLVSNLAIAASAIIVALISGSAALISEGVQSLISAFNTSLLLVGERHAARPPDRDHPFGRGKALFLWTLLSVSLSLVLGGVSAVYRGAVKLMEGGIPGDPGPGLLVFKLT